MIPLLENERLDELQRNHYKIIQNQKKFRFGMDAVLLSGFTIVKKNEIVLDLGTGTGIIPILLEAKTEGKLFFGLEIQQESADMAKRSVQINKQEEKVKIVEGDLKQASNIFGKEMFDVVVTNPPYMKQFHGLQNPNHAKSIARHEIFCNLEDVIRESASVLKNNGRLYMVHRPFRFAEIIQELKKYRLEPKRVRFVYPYVDREPNMVLIEAMKNRNCGMKIEAPLIVYRAPNLYTKEILDLYGY